MESEITIRKANGGFIVDVSDPSDRDCCRNDNIFVNLLDAMDFVSNYFIDINKVQNCDCANKSDEDLSDEDKKHI